MNDEASCYVGGLANEVTENVVEELFIQIGPIKSFTLKKGDNHNYALVEFEDEETVPFAIEVMDGIRLYNRSITVKPRNNTKQEEAWKKMQSERRDPRRNDSHTQPHLPQLDRDSSRKREYNGEPSYNTPRTRSDDLRRPPFPPPLPPSMPRYDTYLTPPPAPPVMGYAPGPDPRSDRWHTPPSMEHLNPRIPPEYDVNFRDRHRNDYSNSRDRDIRRNDRHGDYRHGSRNNDRRDDRDSRHQNSSRSVGRY